MLFASLMILFINESVLYQFMNRTCFHKEVKLSVHNFTESVIYCFLFIISNKHFSEALQKCLMSDVCYKRGITIRTTIRYVPEMNSTAEQFKLTSMEKTRAMI